MNHSVAVRAQQAQVFKPSDDWRIRLAERAIMVNLAEVDPKPRIGFTKVEAAGLALKASSSLEGFLLLRVDNPTVALAPFRSQRVARSSY